MKSIFRYVFFLTFFLMVAGCNVDDASTSSVGSSSSKTDCEYSSSSLENANNDNEPISQRAQSSSSNTEMQSNDGDIAEEIKRTSDSLGKPAYVEGCSLPVYWGLYNDSIVQPTGTLCDSIKIDKPETWKFCTRYIDTTGYYADTVTEFYSYNFEKSCRFIATLNIYHSLGKSKEKSSYNDTQFSGDICNLQECMSTIDMVKTFDKVRKTCLEHKNENHFEVYPNLEAVGIDTTLYIY